MLNFIKQNVKKYLSHYVKVLDDRWNYNERNFVYKSFGNKDPDKIFFVIQKDHINAGLMEDYVNFALAINFALSRGYIPVIDRLHHPAKFQQEESEWYTKNGWEEFFYQPIPQYTVEYVESGAKTVIYAPDFISFGIIEVQSFAGVNFNSLMIENKSIPESGFYASLFRKIAKKYMKFNEETERKLNEIYRGFRQQWNGKRVLGVSLREEMMLRGEPTAVTLKDINEFVKKYMEEWECDYLFVAAEFQERVDEFAAKVSNTTFLDRGRLIGRDDPDEQKMIELCKNYNEENCREIWKILERLMGTKHDRWFYYLAEIYILSKCDCAILQPSSGNIGALMMRDKAYEHVIMLK